MFTLVPGVARPSVVSSSVVGMSANVKLLLFISARVIDTPSTDTEPFGTMYFMSSGGGCMVRRTSSEDSRRLVTLPVPSMWPWTMCPLRRVWGVTHDSRFTGSPGLR